MAVSDPTPAPPPSPPPARNGCLTALMVGIGIVMLLPGVCAMLIIGYDPRHAFSRDNLSAFFSFFAISAGGIVLIWAAVRRR